MKGSAHKNAEVAEADEEMADTDRTLIEELLRNGVSLSRVCDLFSGRADPKRVAEVARRVVAASSSSELGVAVSLPRLGADVLERSATATRDASFMRAHAANLTEEAPEELLDPLFSTLMNDPVGCPRASSSIGTPPWRRTAISGSASAPSRGPLSRGTCIRW